MSPGVPFKETGGACRRLSQCLAGSRIRAFVQLSPQEFLFCQQRARHLRVSIGVSSWSRPLCEISDVRNLLMVTLARGCQAAVPPSSAHSHLTFLLQ